MSRKAAAKRKVVIKEEEEEEKITIKKEKKEEQQFKEAEPQTQEVEEVSSSASKSEEAASEAKSVSEYAVAALEQKAGDTKGDMLRRYLRATCDFLRDSSFRESLDDDVARKWFAMTDEQIAAGLPTALDVVKQLAQIAVFKREDGKYEKTFLFGDLLESASQMAEAELDELVSAKFLLSETEDHKQAELADELPLKSALHRMVARLALDKAEASPLDWWRLLDVFARFCEQMKL